MTAFENKEYKAAGVQDIVVSVGVGVVTMFIIVYLVAEVENLITLPTDSPLTSLLTGITSSFTAAFGIVGIALFIVPFSITGGITQFKERVMKISFNYLELLPQDNKVQARKYIKFNL